MDLTITAVETEQIRVPLVRTYRGSHYKMTHRSTIITRIYTAGGLVAEAYAGDEDAGLAEIDSIIHDEIAPKILGEDGSAIERLWEIARPATWDILRDRRLGLVATASVDLPDKSASQILQFINTNPDIAFSGKVVKVADLGLPPMNIIPDISQSMVDQMAKNAPKEMKDFLPQASAQGELALALEFLGGTHRANIYVDGVKK